MNLLREHSHTRVNALTGETILVSPHRLQRPWQGQVEETPAEARPAHDPQCYLCPGNVRAGGHRNPAYTGTFVFDNDFAALHSDSTAEFESPHELLSAAPESGICRVVCFSPRHDLTLAEMDQPAIRRVVDTWTDETASLSARPGIACVQVFENKGAMMGCSNPHPHGQIWATSSIPHEHAIEDARQREWCARQGRTLLADYLDVELRAQERIVCANDSWVCLVPWWAKWPFETLVVSRRPVASLLQLPDGERGELADILRRTAARYDNLFRVSFPYTMGIHQAPPMAGTHHWHLHAHFYPPLLRSATVRKFMVGFEMLAMPQRDITPESAAEQLRAQSEKHYLAR